MRKERLFSMDSPFRDTFHITGFRFGQGAKSLAIVGAMRGDEIQQQYICAQLVHQLSRLEAQGLLANDHEILVIPSANPFSMNIEKRFWAMDGTDINRMFPGYDRGETTQRIAAALFEQLKGYTYGIQLASFYIPGDFVPHVRLMRTGYEDTEGSKRFGMPYITLRKPLPFDTTLLNYNWQIWETKAYSLYGGMNDGVESPVTTEMIGTILRFAQRIGLTQKPVVGIPDFNPQVIDESSFITVRTPQAGILYRLKGAGDKVHEGEVLARILDPYEGSIKAEITSPTDGLIFFAHNKPLALENTLLFNIL